MTTATTTRPLPRTNDAPSPRPHRTRWVAAAALSVAAVTAGVVAALDGSGGDRPATGPQAPAAVTEGAPSMDVGITSADAAERRSLAQQSATADRCAELPADAAERCVSG